MPLVILPLHNNLLLEAIQASNQTPSGLILPESAQHAPPQGKVIDRGPDVSDNIKIGDILFYPHSTEANIDYKGKKYKMVSEDAVLGVIRDIPASDVKAAK